MKKTKKILLLIFVKLAIGATIFLLMDWMINSEKPITNKGTYIAYIGFAIFIIGETIWNTSKQKNKMNETKTKMIK
jgi:hypothetical protein